MATTSKQKLRPLYILKLLQECTDEAHVITTPELIEHLELQGIPVERKTIYDDIEKLREFGYDIVTVKSRQGGGYYMASREFELPELKLLVDAVQSSRFITTKKSRKLIKKLECLAGKYDAFRLQRQVYVAGRIKTENESIYYNIDAIHQSIQENLQITFTYLDWDIHKNLVPRVNSHKQVSPMALVWREDNYYLVAYETTSRMIKHYRVDKMGKVELSSAKREGQELLEAMDFTAYVNQTFGMFAGEQERITLEFPNRYIGVVLDRFGQEAELRPVGEEHFRVRIRVAVSGQFFGWLTGIGREAVVVSPQSVKEQYQSWLRDILQAEKSLP